MKNQLYYGDNLEVLRKYIKDESVDLCYIDPPFNSKRNYNQIYNNIGTEDKAQAQAFIDTWTWTQLSNDELKAIQETQNKLLTKQSISLITGLENVLGKGSLFAYLVSMTHRIAEIHRVLKPTGSFYLHCDPTASHYLKLILDSIFCSQGGEFVNEITWKRSTAKGDAKQGAKHFGRITDIVLYYAKNVDEYLFNAQYEAYTEEALKRDYKYIEEGTNRIYRLAPLDGPGGASKGNPYYEFLNVKGYWRFSQEKMQKMYEKGYIIRSKTGKTLSQKMYLDESKGRQIDNFWYDINKIAPTSKERLGYPTQKPEALLERIIKASSNEGDVVLDAYCGCGTSIAVAERLKRNWLGIDITYQSISLILKRLEDSFGKSLLDDIILSGVPKDFSSAVALANKKDDRVRKEFEKWSVLTFSSNRAIINDKKGGDGGIDGIAYMVDFDESNKVAYKQVIFSVKSSKTLSPTVIRDLFGTMEREKAEIGYLITLYPMPNLVKEATKYGTYQNKMFGHTYPKISVVSIQELLDGQRMNLPTAEVLKSAERKSGNDAPTIF